MIAPARPALAALEAGIAHVARHHRGPAAVATTAVALRVALNVMRELDTLLGHAVAEAAAIAGVVLVASADAPASRSLAEFAGVLGPRSAASAQLARADRARVALHRALADPGRLARYRLPAIYPHAIGTTYRRIARDLASTGAREGWIAGPVVVDVPPYRAVAVLAAGAA